MPINPNIALSFQPAQIESPLNSLSRMLQLEGAQQTNALNAMKMDEYQRTVNDTNRLNGFYSNALGADGKIDRTSLFRNVATGGLGSKIPGLQKGFLEADEAQGKVDKQKVELVDAKLKQSRAFLDSVQTPDQYLAWHEANHADPVLGPVLAARGVTADQARGQILQALQLPGGFQQLLQKSALGLEKFTEMNKPTYQNQNLGGTVQTLALPGLGGAPSVVSTSTVTQSPDNAATNERARADAAAARAQSDRHFNVTQDNAGNTYDTERGMVVNTRKGTATPVIQGGQPLAPKPSEAVKKEMLSINQQRSVLQGALDAVKATPSAFSAGRGIAGKLPFGESTAGRFETPEETQARAYVFNNVSRVINERAGAAQSAQELARLNTFLPADTDGPDQITNKLIGFQNYLNDLEKGTTSAPGGALSPQDKAKAEMARRGIK